MSREPLPNYLKGNLTAANARLAELRFRERDEIVTPVEKLSIWKWLDPKRMPVARDIGPSLFGDPSSARSAIGGWKQKGELIKDSWSERKGRVGKWENSRICYRVPKTNCVASTSAVAIAIATLRGCRFPVGDIKSADFHFCNEKRSGASSYCARHAFLCGGRRP